MNDLNKKLMIQQLDKKIAAFSDLDKVSVPSEGWIKSIRIALNMSLAQFAKLLKKSSPTVRELEQREANKSITLNKLMEVAEGLDLKLVYGFIPKEGSLEKMIEKRASQIAKKLVERTSHTMKLEDQQVSDKRIQDAIKDRTEKIKYEMPKYLWD